MILLLIPLVVFIAVARMLMAADDTCCKRCGWPYWGQHRVCKCERS